MINAFFFSHESKNGDPMDTLKDLINEHGPLLIDKLECIGFSVDQANNFLPEAGKAIDHALSTGSIDFQALFNDVEMEPLLNGFDVNTIATKIGIDASQVINGIMRIWPFLVQRLLVETDELADPQLFFINGMENSKHSSFEKLRKNFLN